MAKEKTTTTTTAVKADETPEAEVILATPGTRLIHPPAEPGRAVRIEKADGTIVTTFM